MNQKTRRKEPGAAASEPRCEADGSDPKARNRYFVTKTDFAHSASGPTLTSFQSVGQDYMNQVVLPKIFLGFCRNIMLNFGT
jgi:hypothetical protein